MADLTLRDDLVKRLLQIANQEHRRLDEVVETMLDQYSRAEPINPDLANELRRDRIRTYDRARAYWQRLGDPRQHLSDKDLDEQFWLIDHDGIPRLNEEKSTVEIPADPLSQMLEMVEADRTIQWQAVSKSESAKEILNREYTDHLLARLNSTDAPDE